ncbi:hypothetical protein EGW08_020691 [Elysia chlorotica]|uniref:C-type lectin domain-containing protein n=1 Tax=Elysia chlorotica TaxID=188477 RepID=A0A3S1AYF9_ELYCH|nr:hypothetical protein EGW08_020691 [Elysia chlorotica]
MQSTLGTRNMFFAAITLLFLISVAAESTLQNSCPTEVLKKVNAFYLQVHDGICFHFVTNEKRTHSDASRECRHYDGLLAMPKTKSINDFLTTKATTVYGVSDPMWIGLHDRINEKEFVWEDNTKLVWGNFKKGNGPGNNIFQGSFEDCVVIHPSDGGLWGDDQCERDIISIISGSKPKKKYICQYTLDIVNNTVNDAIKNKDPKVKDQQDVDQQDTDQQAVDQQDVDQQDTDQQM